ncbi:MAG: hypothetical protein ACR2JE_11875 [Acidobacteriaceae bacterium]
MQPQDRLKIQFTQAGLFCSKDGDDFKPPLPNNQRFHPGDVWPDPEEYRDGATPAGDGDAQYSYKVPPADKCEEPTHGDPDVGTIHIGK